MATASPHDENVPVRQLRSRRDSTPVPTELVDAANPLAIAFHLSTSLADTDATTPKALGHYWGAGRRKTREAKDVLLAHGLWFEVRVPQRDGGEWRGWSVEYRAVESRATDRDVAELATEYPVGTRISTAGGTWRVDETGCPTPASGSTTEIGPAAGQKSETETGHRPSGSTTEIGPAAGQKSETETGSELDLPYIGDTSGISVGEIPEVVGSAAPPADAGAGAAAHDDVDWARQLVRELPWHSVLRRELKKPEANDLADRFRRAHHVHGLTKDQVQTYALTKLASADPDKNPVRWVIGAFQDQRLAQYAAWLETEPLSSSPLSLPETADQEDGEPNKSVSEPSQPASDDSNAATWCGDCVPVRTETGKRCSSDCSGPEKAATDSGPSGGGMPEHVRVELHACREQQRLARIRRIHGYSA